MGESAKRFPTREAIQTNKRERDELRNPCYRSLTTRRVSLGTQVLGVDCVAYLTLRGVSQCCMPRSSAPPQYGLSRRHDKLCEGLVGLWVGLDQRCKNLRMLPEVSQEGIAAPAAHHLHSLYGKTSQQVEERGSDSYTVTLERL